MNVRLLRSGKEKELLDTIADNLELYRTGNFEYLLTDSSVYIDTDIGINECKLENIYCTAEVHREVECCIALFEALNGLTQYLARDSRVWVYLTHTLLLEYSRERWPIPDEDDKAIAFIKNHFFIVGKREIERDNAASRLWWMASLCSRVNGLTLEQSLTAFLHKYDVRANIIERPTTSQSAAVFSSVIKKLYESYQGDQSLFDREKFRKLMKDLNLRGGARLISAMDESEVTQILNDCLT